MGTDFDVFVGLSQFNSKKLRFQHMQHLISVITDLAAIPRPLIPLAMQAMYVCAGCDLISISFIHGFGKAIFLFEYGNFICSNSEQTPETVANTESEHSTSVIPSSSLDALTSESISNASHLNLQGSS